MKRLLLFSIMMLMASSTYSSVPPDECLKYYWDGPLPVGSVNPYFMNEDSVMIDSCENSDTYLRLFIEGPYQLQLDYNIIPRSEIYSPDTVINYTIDDIDPMYTDAINAFKSLESEYGSFRFQEVAPDRADSTAFIKRSLFIYFTSPQEILKTENVIRELESVKSARCLAKYGVVTNVETESQNISLYPNPAKEEINISYDKMINSIEILDLNGKEIISNRNLAPQMEQSIKVDYLHAGTYLIRINDNVYKRFVKE